MTIKHLANHAGSTMEEGGDIRRLIEDLVMPSFPVPPLADGASKQEEKMWDYDYKEYKVRTARLRKNCENLFSIILGQCTPAMRAKLESQEAWKKMKEEYNTIDLLKALRDITYKFEGHKNAYLSLHMAQRDAFLIKQGKNESVTDYRERHDAVTGVLEGVGGVALWGSPTTIDIELKKIDPSLSLHTVDHTDEGEKTSLATAMARSTEKALAMHLLLGADRARFHTLLIGLENDHILGQDKYPNTRVEVYNTLINTKTPRAGRGERDDGYDPNSEVSFLQDGEVEEEEKPPRNETAAA